MLLLAPAPILLFGFAIIGSGWPESTAFTTAIVAITLCSTALVCCGVRTEWLAENPCYLPSQFEAIQSVLSVVVGAIVTYAMVVELGLSSVVAAGLVAIASAFVFPKESVAVYTGAFVGMTSPDLFTSYGHAVLAAVLAGVAFALVRPVFDGIGGKLGTVAFVSAVPVVLLTATEFHGEPLPAPDVSVLVVVSSIGGAILTYTISVEGNRSPVFASGFVGVLGGVLLPLGAPNAGSLLAAAVFCASFVGMASPERISGPTNIGLAGAIAGVVVISTTPFLGGSGGKLGTIAFGACLAVLGLEQLYTGARSWGGR